MTTPKEELIQGIDRARVSGRAAAIDPPMSRVQIINLKSKVGTALPADIGELVEYAAGFSVDGIAVHFGGEEAFEFESAFPRAVPIATDGAGNFWVVDIASDGSWGAVFLVAHDPPVVVLQARDIAPFIAQVFDAHDTAELQNKLAAQIWKANPYVISQEQALASPDPAVRAFAQQLNENFLIADLRDAARGKGFVWGIAGPNTDVRRAENQLLFATQQKKRGMLARLFWR
ncbi:MAG: SMI1/KNR4 family protein [Acidobacteriota bacterium]